MGLTPLPAPRSSGHRRPSLRADFPFLIRPIRMPGVLPLSRLTALAAVVPLAVSQSVFSVSPVALGSSPGARASRASRPSRTRSPGRSATSSTHRDRTTRTTPARSLSCRAPSPRRPATAFGQPRAKQRGEPMHRVPLRARSRGSRAAAASAPYLPTAERGAGQSHGAGGWLGHEDRPVSHPVHVRPDGPPVLIRPARRERRDRSRIGAGHHAAMRKMATPWPSLRDHGGPEREDEEAVDRERDGGGVMAVAPA